MIALIDGDVLCYLSCYDRWHGIPVKLDETGKRLPHEFSEGEDRKFLENSWSNFHKELEALQEELYTEHFLMAVKGETNFRDDLYADYKKQRKPGGKVSVQMGMIREFVPIIRALAVHEGLAIHAEGREADDYLRIWASEARASGDDYVICSIDKDLLCIPGKHYDIKKKILREVSEFEARQFYYEQLLKGDPTDNIPGLPGIGGVKAAKMLADCVTEEDFQEAVLAAYISTFPEDWQHQLLINGKLIHIQNHIHDYFSFRHWPAANGLF